MCRQGGARAGQHGLPELVHQVPPEKEAAGDPQDSAEHTYHGTFAEHPADQPDRSGTHRPDGPHHRSTVLNGEQDRIQGDEETDQDPGHQVQVEAL